MRYVVCASIIVISTVVGAQDRNVRPHFEVATVKPVAEDRINDPAIAKALQDARRNSLGGGKIPMVGADRVRLQDLPLLDLIATAYSVDITQVSGPAWLSDRHFDIEAKVPVGTTQGELNGMLQSLLEERFALKIHRSTQSKNGYALTVDKRGSKLKPAKPPGGASGTLAETEVQAQVTQRLEAMKKRVNSGSGPWSFVSWPSITVEELALKLVRFTGAPVVDRTGLSGRYSVELEVSQAPDEVGNTIFDAVEKLGLELKPSRVPLELLVVDQASKTPTAN